MIAQIVPLTFTLRVHIDPRRGNFDLLADTGGGRWAG